MSLVYTATQRSSNGGKRNSLYIGGRSDASKLEKLERYGISHILNATPSKEATIQAGVPNFFEKKSKFRYKRISIYDAPTSATQLVEAAESVIQFISNGLLHGSVLVHCQHGVSRSTTCALFYLIRKAGMSLKDALQMIQRRRPQAQPIPAFMEILEQFEKEHRSGDCNDPKKRVSRHQVSPHDRKRQRVGPSIGPAGPPNKHREQEQPKKKENTSITGPSLPPTMARGGNGRALELAHGTKQIGPLLPPKQSKDLLEPSHAPNENDRSTSAHLER